MPDNDISHWWGRIRQDLGDDRPDCFLWKEIRDKLDHALLGGHQAFVNELESLYGGGGTVEVHFVDGEFPGHRPARPAAPKQEYLPAPPADLEETRRKLANAKRLLEEL